PVLARRGRVAHGFNQLADVVHAGAACGVDLLHVRARAGNDLATGRALPARALGRPPLAVETARENAGKRGLPDAARPGQEESVGHSTKADGVAQGGRHVVLAGHLLKALRTPLAREDLVAQGGGLRWLLGPGLSEGAARRDRRAPPLATETSLPLLPSGPDGVHEARDRPGPCDRGSPHGQGRCYWPLA